MGEQNGPFGHGTRRKLQFDVERRSARVKSLPWECVLELRQAYPQRAYPHERRRGSMKKLVLTGLALGAAMAVGAAQAEPLTLSQDQMDGVTAAGYGTVQFDAYVTNKYDSYKDINLKKYADVYVENDIDGWLADAEAGSNCFGFGCTAETKTLADTDFTKFSAVAYSSSIAASDFPEMKDDGGKKY
jgi:hypothetical protein